MRVVLPFDGSQPAKRAVGYLVTLARQMHAGGLEVHVVNAQDVSAGMAGVFGGDAADTAAKLAHGAMENGRLLLTEAVGPLRAAGLAVELLPRARPRDPGAGWVRASTDIDVRGGRTE